MVPEIPSAQQTKFFVVLNYFLPFYPPPPSQQPKNQNFEKKTIRKQTKNKKNKTGEIIILHMCTINDNDVC